MYGYLGVDVGSISTNLAVIDERGELLIKSYLYTDGQPINAVKYGLKELRDGLSPGFEIKGSGTTGSARYLTGAIIGADCIKNEITAHGVATVHFLPEVRTIIEIGGQDSKIIILQDGIVVDFGMNSVCAAGTGSFLDHQAARLNIPIQEFGSLALKSENPVHIAGRCTVFAESDMIHKQQIGAKIEDIIAGLCEGLVRNYLSNVAKGKRILPPVAFQGGVAANAGIRKALEEQLGQKTIVPEHYDVMGAIGAALLAKEEVEVRGELQTKFRGFEASDMDFKTRGFECQGCPNRCEVVEVLLDREAIDCWGGLCGRWDKEYRISEARPASFTQDLNSLLEGCSKLGFLKNR